MERQMVIRAVMFFLKGFLGSGSVLRASGLRGWVVHPFLYVCGRELVGDNFVVTFFLIIHWDEAVAATPAEP